MLATILASLSFKLKLFLASLFQAELSLSLSLSLSSKLLIFFARHNSSISFFQTETSLSISEEFGIFLLETMAGTEVVPAIGIDLGTNYSAVAVWKSGGDPFIKKIPSYVAFSGAKHLVGDKAKEQVDKNPEFFF